MRTPNKLKIGKDWDEHCKTLTNADCERYQEALKTLSEWKEFKDAFGWTLMFTLDGYLKYSRY
jgi:hypothetical protein